MKIPDLHTVLHPKLGPYCGPTDNYAHSLSNDLSALLERQSDGTWCVSLLERGHAELIHTQQSESQACKSLMALIGKQL